MSKTCVRGLALSLAVLSVAGALLGQQAEKKASAPKAGCEPGTCVSKVVYFPNSATPYELQDVVNTVRVFAGITRIDQNQSEHTISLEATAEQIAIAEKLVSVLEKLKLSGGSSPSSVLVYETKPAPPESAMSDKAPDNSSVAARTSCERNTCLIKVLYLPDFASSFELQDVVNMVRTLTDITRIVPSGAGHTIGIQGTAEQVGIAERVVSVLETLQASGGNKRTSVLVYEVKGLMPEPAVSEKMSEQTIERMRKTACELTTCVIKALYLPDLSTHELQDVINRVRTTAQVTHIVPSQTRHVVAIRGTSEQVALAEKLVNE